MICLVGHQGEGDSGEFAGQSDFGSDFGKSFDELLLIVVVEECIGSCGLSGAEQQPSYFGFTALGEFSFAFVFSGFTQAHIKADEGNEGIATGEGAAMKHADQSDGIQGADAGNGQTSLIIRQPTERSHECL